MKKTAASKKSIAQTHANPTEVQRTAAAVADDGAAAFEATRAAREALATSELLPINVDVAASALIAHGAVPRLEPYTEALKTLPDTLPTPADVKQCALAAAHANSCWMHGGASPDELQHLVAEATPLRNRIVLVLQMLVAYGVVEQTFVDGLRSSTGFMSLVSDLQGSEVVLRAKWPEIEDRVPVTLDDLDNMRGLAARIEIAVGVKDSADAQATEDRQRAFTLLAKTYDRVHRGMTYLRWHEGDADQIMPSLWLRPGGSRRTGSDASNTTPAAPGSVPVTPASPTTATATRATPVAPAPSPAPAGPLGSPFIS